MHCNFLTSSLYVMSVILSSGLENFSADVAATKIDTEILARAKTQYDKTEKKQPPQKGKGKGDGQGDFVLVLPLVIACAHQPFLCR